MTKKRQGEPWIPGHEYGRAMPQFSLNLLVRDIDRSVAFYRDVLEATVHYTDPDFAAIRVLDQELMLHVDHTYEGHPMHEQLVSGDPRGLGAEIRLFGMDPDALEARALTAGAEIIVAAGDRGHGWRDLTIADPDGYLWAVGLPN